MPTPTDFFKNQKCGKNVLLKKKIMIDHKIESTNPDSYDDKLKGSFRIKKYI